MDVWKKKFSICGIIENNGYIVVWMKARKYVDVTENTAIITFHNAKTDSMNTIVTMERELRKKEQDVCMEIENAAINLQHRFLSEFAQDEEKKCIREILSIIF